MRWKGIDKINNLLLIHVLAVQRPNESNPLGFCCDIVKPVLSGTRQERGIYAFTLELTGLKLPPHGYILYVGIAGDTSGSSLQKRYGQYLQELRSESGRPAVFYMMRNWPDDLFFNFVALPNKKVDLAKLERAFINSVMPPANSAIVPKAPTPIAESSSAEWTWLFAQPLRSDSSFPALTRLKSARN